MGYFHAVSKISLWINSTVLVMGRDLFIFAMLSPAELKRPSKDPALTGSIPEEDDDDDDDLLIYINSSILKVKTLHWQNNSKSNIKIVERGKLDTLHIQIHDRSWITFLTLYIYINNKVRGLN